VSVVRLKPPGDKSITHRALVLAALAEGRSELERPLTSWDARSMASALRALGVSVSPLRAGGRVTVVGRGLSGLTDPGKSLHCGNSGTTARLLLGVLSAFPFAVRITGDASLRRRPMRRVTVPLASMGARFEEEAGDGLPLVVRGGQLRPLEYRMPVASAQVKGALLLAGLAGRVAVQVSEPRRSRDHTERMLGALGVPVSTAGATVALSPVERLPAFRVRIPADPSSAAFLLAAGLVAGVPVTVEDVGINPTRAGMLEVLRRMGAHLEVSPKGSALGEPFGDVTVWPSALRACRVEAGEVPAVIDEIPVLAVLASRAQGVSVFEQVGELRVKESNRLELLAANLRAVGVASEVQGDSLVVEGPSGPPRGFIETARDHRLAMAFAVLGTAPGARVELSERVSVAVSYPDFFEDLRAVLSAASGGS
jgi:3-phosphoshikimate 1-carboxyvinyltransferase